MSPIRLEISDYNHLLNWLNHMCTQIYNIIDTNIISLSRLYNSLWFDFIDDMGSLDTDSKKGDFDVNNLKENNLPK